ncbi:hypothetical protein [Thermococcus sp. MV11]|uniref:hypothetical protein n=1 Tax=Thermococcus sp. MV11 TaxID=1638267 RepID=UPI001431FEB1|nr:hypothetical protein [Thermococcus sp. MV11]NJE04234.1 hypothetical protein [Thermococcus sp. MV11]
MNLEGIITARYTGSKYWNSDANAGIMKGTAMAFSPLLLSGLATFSEIATVESSTGVELALAGKAKVAFEATFGIYGKLVGGSIGMYNLAEIVAMNKSAKEKAKKVAEYFLKPLFLPGG